jgi:hypothetical protein
LFLFTLKSAILKNTLSVERIWEEFMKRSQRMSIKILAALVIVFGLAASMFTTSQAFAIPTISIKTVVTDTSVTIAGINFPADQTFTVRMGAFGTMGIGGVVVGTKEPASGSSALPILSRHRWQGRKRSPSGLTAPKDIIPTTGSIIIRIILPLSFQWELRFRATQVFRHSQLVRWLAVLPCQFSPATSRRTRPSQCGWENLVPLPSAG